MVKHVKSQSEFTEFISQPTLTVVDFHAVWCGPCKFVAPFFDKFADKYPTANFIKVNCDEVKDVAKACHISAMPTFQFYRNGTKIDEMKGADCVQLENMIAKHAGSSTGSSQQDMPKYISNGYRDVTDQINLSALHCLNEKSTHSVKQMIQGETWLESDVDEQLLINLEFKQLMKLHSIKFIIPASESSADCAPKTVKLYANQIGMGFDSTDSVEPTQVLELTPADFDENQATALRFVKFQAVTSLSIFVQDNQSDGEVTVLKGIKLIGIAQDITDVSALKKNSDDH